MLLLELNIRVSRKGTNLQTFDLINSEPGGVGDLLEVDVSVGVGLGHPGLLVLLLLKGDVRGSGSLGTTAEAKRGVREGQLTALNNPCPGLSRSALQGEGGPRSFKRHLTQGLRSLELSTAPNKDFFP